MQFRNALSKGLQQVAKAAGELITYRRGTVTAQITATRGSKQTEQNSQQSSTIQAGRHDWIINADQMQLSTGTIQPIEGDEIIDSAGVTYRVTKDPGDGKCSRWLTHNVACRIHTLIVEGEK
jgi:hypothetical protein